MQQQNILFFTRCKHSVNGLMLGQRGSWANGVGFPRRPTNKVF